MSGSVKNMPKNMLIKNSERVKSLMQKLKLSLEEALNTLSIAGDEKKQIVKQLQK